jgi:hypothetical protein
VKTAAAFVLVAVAASIALPAVGAVAQTPAPLMGPASSAAAMCGFVSFVPVGAPRVTNGTMMERIRATVTFADGHTESATFPYLWVFPNGEQTDPWSNTNLTRDSGFSIAMQLPPPGTDQRTLPPLIASIIAHTDAAGFTGLVDCTPRASHAALAKPPLSEKPLSANAPPVVRFVDESAEDSPVKILDATFAPVGAGEHRIPGIVQQCVTYKNDSARMVSDVRIRFTYLHVDGTRGLGHALGRIGPLAPGAVVHGVRREPTSLADAVSDTSNCRVWAFPGGILVLKATVTSVIFADGTTWRERAHAVTPAPR